MTPTPEAIAAFVQQVQEWQVQYGDEMVCPVTGLVVPKTLEANVKWRQDIRRQCRENPALRAAVRAACKRSFIYWCNLFAFTFHQKWVDDAGIEIAVTGEACHVPFITWKIQDDAALKIIECIEKGEDVLIDKSRDMGASWLVAAVFQWLWQFRANSTFLEVSRKEMYVDQRGNMDSLFEKHRYMLRMQPVWMRPKAIRDNSMLIENKDNNSTLIGESTNDDVGQGGRKTAILLDEFARVRNGEAIDLATADTAACRIFNSTVNGPGTHYTRIYRDIKAGKRAGVIIELPWEAHPAKGRGLSIIDVKMSPRHPLGKKAVSPWYIHEQATRSAKDLAQNVDRDHGKSGDSFFDPQEIEAHRLNFQADPLFMGNLVWDDELNEEERKGVFLNYEASAVTFVQEGFRRLWKLWCPLIAGRPNQSHAYVFGVDISMGTGSSNSVISVFDDTINAKVAEFADAFTSPEDLGIMVAMAATWFGGATRRPLLIWETNGPGSIFGKKVMSLNYAPIYYLKTEGVKVPKATLRYGWNSNATRKEILLGAYREAMKNAKFINPSKESLDEAIDYVYNDKGLLVPATSKAEAGGAAQTHGDRVVADALCHLGRMDLPSIKPTTPRAPRNSFAGRREEHTRLRRSEKEAWGR